MNYSPFHDLPLQFLLICRWNFEDMQRRLDQFRSMDVRKAGNITLSEFAAYLHLPVSSAVEELFALYDRVGNSSQ